MRQRSLVTASEMADILKLSVETVWRYTRDGKIPYVEMSGRQYRYDPEAVLASLGIGAACVRERAPAYSDDKVYTYDDYLKLPDEDGYSCEILDGVLVKEPSPIVHHQRVALRLARLLEDYFAVVDPLGEVFIAPLDVTLSNTNVVQPDLLYIPSGQSAIMEETRINGSPYLLVEVLSTHTRSKDRVKKRAIYERMGVPHYWIVDQFDDAIEAYALMNGRYVMAASGCGDAEFTHPDFPGLKIQLAALWRRPAIALEAQ